jgi:predicted amidohydrolase
MGTIRVAFLQLTAGATVADNLQSGVEACRQARANGADIALLPEVWSHGYAFPDADDAGAAERWRDTALREDSEFVRAHRELAAETGLAIGLTFLEAHANGPRNFLCLIDGAGEIVLRYAKVHTCEFTAERLCAPGEGFSVATLQTDKGPLEVGAMICYDRENPESARILGIKGAELVLVPNACIIEEHRVAQMKTRAFENMLALAMTNYPDTHAEGNGHSLGIVPMAFSLGGEKNGQGRHQETLMLEADAAAGIYYCDFDLDEIRAYRKRAIWGANARRPAAYADLLNEAKMPDLEPDTIIH